MNVIFIIIGMNVSLIFLFDKSKLDSKEWFFKLLILNVILFLIALISYFTGFGKNTAINSLFVPLMAQFAYYVLSKSFYLKYKRNSVDTFWTMDKSLFLDGWFNYMFWLISILLFLFVL
ncbi:hypothetical protein [Flavobacterium glaciei]|uniref:Uncharacterized protein n=1 Tax=Flavobacterium glaciei TaxID=386300 RepID=A0A562PKY1_9FLAO|nr:hypothetical protein [Flavobacterium glaciei]RDI51214.1 hypothetical protein DFR66_11556 [Flavobacterium glaciei]TWI45094.1 hypothetical protein IQ02_02453 [Flavobacterium glaciei]